MAKFFWTEWEETIIKKVFGEISKEKINKKPECILLVFDKKRIANLVENSWISFEWIKRKEDFEEFKNLSQRSGSTTHKIDYVKQKLGDGYDWLIEYKYLVELNDGRVTTSRLYKAEKCIADFLRNNTDKINKFYDSKRVEKIISTWEVHNFKITKEQRYATHRAIKYRLSFINGNAGTGKTSVLKLIVFILDNLKCDIVALSPTGKAAKKLSRTTGLPATTIHSKLSIGSNETMEDGAEKKYENEPWWDEEKSSVIMPCYAIVDESSMISLQMLAILITKGDFDNYIFIGDDKQLPSVQPGNFLDEIIKSNDFKATTLSVVKRQSIDSNILKVATSIIKNDTSSIEWEGKKDIEFIASKDFELKKIISMFEEDYKLYGPNEVVILSPMKGKGYGVDIINKLIRDRVNPGSYNKKEIDHYGTIFRVGDVVMNTKNKFIGSHYIPNGETGVIKDAFKIGIKRVLKIDFDGSLVTIESRDINDIIHSYALTIHKSQGSEYRSVFLVCHHEHLFMLKENILYTGVTRAKEKLTIYGNKFIFKKASLAKDSKLRESAFYKIYKGEIHEVNK